MLLQEKIYNNEEIAKWFGISYNSLKTMKKEKLEELKEYAEFETIKGKIKITKVKEAEYHNNLKSIRNYVKENLLKVWDLEGIETCTRVAAKLCLNYREERNVSEDKAKESSFLYCVTKERDLQIPIRTKTWAKMYGTIGKDKTNTKTRADNKYSELNDDEKQTFCDEFYKRYKRDNVATAILELNKKYKRGELSDSAEKWNEAWKEFCEITGANEVPFTSFLSEISNDFKCNWMIHGVKK